jgi:hypothetical protein
VFLAFASMLLLSALTQTRPIEATNIAKSTIDPPLLTTYENRTNHSGDLVIVGYREFIIENCTFIQTGNIYVRDYGKLIVRNVELQINQTRLWHYELKIEDYGTMEFENVSLITKFGLNIYFRHRTQISFSNSFIEFNPLIYMHFSDSSKTNISSSNLPVGLSVSQYSHLSIVNSTIGDLFLQASSRSVVIVSDSTIDRISVGAFDYGTPINMHGLKSGFHDYLNLAERLHPIESSLTLTKVFVEAWWASFSYDADVRISDCTLILLISYYDASEHLSGLSPVFYNYTIIGRIQLINTTVVWFMICAHNSKLTIENSVIHFFASGDSQVIFMNSSIDTHIGDFYGSLYFRNTKCKWRGGILVHYSSFFIVGNLTFEPGPPWIAWLETNITRNYNTIVRDSYGNLISNVSLVLCSKDNIPIWNGMTNSEGKANFNITFVDADYEGFWTLTASTDNQNASKQIKFFTDTPVEIMLDNMPPNVVVAHPVNVSVVYGTVEIRVLANDNVQLDRIILYVDESLVDEVKLAGKSYTYTTSLNTRSLVNGTHRISITVYDNSGNMNASSITINIQNLMGDLDGNGAVNIIDIAIVARAFGSKSGDTRWNSIADLDGNGVINIIDVSMVAKQFGKTVVVKAK